MRNKSNRAVLVGALLLYCPFGVAQTARPALLPVFSELYTFLGGSDGVVPTTLTVGPGGTLFGATTLGGSDGCVGPGCGTVFQLTPPAVPNGAWTENVIHRFGGPDGAFPYGAPAMDGQAVLYGTTYGGGTFGTGTVFELRPPSAPGGPWKEKVIHSFNPNGIDGFDPYAAVTIGKGGVLYGTTSGGGEYDAGTVFQLTPPSTPGGPWSETILHSFANNPDGAYPSSGVTIGGGGELYGIAFIGGSYGVGAVYALSPPSVEGADWSEQIIYSFNYLTGGGFSPYTGLVNDRHGTLYGTTEYGGVYGSGTVFELSPPAIADGDWTEALLYSFTGGSDGGSPKAGLVLGVNGLLYGTTSAGGLSNLGTLFCWLLLRSGAGHGLPWCFTASPGRPTGRIQLQVWRLGRTVRFTARRKGDPQATA